VIIFLDLEESEDPEIFGDASQPPVIKVKNLESCVCGTNVGTTPIHLSSVNDFVAQL
jgi:hypothetical protein